MHYFSTNDRSAHVTFGEAVLRGQPADRGLYFPERIPRLSAGFLESFGRKSNEEIAFEVIRPYVEGEIADEKLFEICAETVNFPFPLVEINEKISALELFHGPTLAFKDVGARFMSRCLRHFSAEKREKTIVLVATSGDTGGAVANGFHGVEGIAVVILYPQGKVSRVQELQLTTLGGNVTALEVGGTFDDCQALAKRALADAELQSRVFITSANSINVARWLPQQFYYFFALKNWEGAPPVISVPSGNFGNICAGILAHISGLRVKKFIAACNANDVIPRFMQTAELEPRPSVATLSNAMDVGDPSNFVRILEIFGRDFPALKERLESVSISDDTTAATMREVYEKYGYILDPHGAVGYRALEDDGRNGIFLETAHPVKFDSVGEILGIEIETPGNVRDLFSREVRRIPMRPDYEQLRELILR
jgi:threonine synthase